MNSVSPLSVFGTACPSPQRSERILPLPLAGSNWDGLAEGYRVRYACCFRFFVRRATLTDANYIRPEIGISAPVIARA